MTENPYRPEQLSPKGYTNTLTLSHTEIWQEGYQAGIKKALEEVEKVILQCAWFDNKDYCDECNRALPHCENREYQSLKKKLMGGE